MHILTVQQIGSCNRVAGLLFHVEVTVLIGVAHQTCARHAIKSGTAEHGNTEQGTPEKHQNTGATYSQILAQSEYQGTVEHVKSSE